jgi:outer membrane protein TolC
VDANGTPIPGNFVPVTAGGTTTIVSQTSRGLPQAWTQAFHSNFPQYTVGLSLSIPLRNRSAQADNARALIEERQAEVRLQQLRNQVAVEVRNAQIALEQNRARVEAAQKARVLAEQTLDAEQKKFALGASTIFLVIQAQRDLSSAQGAEVSAMSDFMKSGVEFDRSLGRTLDVHRIQMSSAKADPSPLAPSMAGLAAALK